MRKKKKGDECEGIKKRGKKENIVRRNGRFYKNKKLMMSWKKIV